MASSDRDPEQSRASTILYSPYDNEPHYDVFFIHGLSGHPVRSWTHEKRREKSCLWPQDLLPVDFPSSRIISLGYNSNLIGSDATSLNIFDHARALLADIRGFRSGVTGRPILFFAHNIGGNILKEALITAFHEDVQEGENIASCTKAVVFFAIPQRDSEIMETFYMMIRISRLLGFTTARKLLNQLRPGSDYLHEASIRFNEVLKTIPMQLFSIYATLPVRSGFQRISYATKQDVLIGNPNEQCLPFEGTANDIQRMFGNEDPNYEKLLRLIRPLLELPSMSNLLEGPTGSTNSAPDNKPSDAHAQGAELPELAGTPGADALPEVAPGTRLEQTIADLELERIEALELGLVRIVISLPSRETSKGKIDVPLAALLDIESSQNSVSQTFVNQILDDYDWDIQKSTGRNKQMTLDFRPARGGTAQSRYFVVRDDIPHPMILAGVGLFSGRGTRDYMKRNPSLSPATDDYQPTVTQDAGGPQFPTRVVTTMPCQRPVTSTLGGFNEVSFPAGPGGSNLQVQGNLISSTQALPKSIVSRTLESGRELARGVAAASESSTWGPSTGITLAAGVTGVGMLANSGYASYVATKALHQTKRSAEISEQSLALHREVFEYTKASKPAAGAGTGPKSSNPTSDSDSDSGDVDSHIGGSSSKSASLRVIQGRTTTPVAASPQRMQRSKVFLQGAAVKGPWTKSDRGNVSALHTRTLLASAPSAPHGPLQPHSNSLPSLTSSHESDINMRRLRETRAPTHNFDASIRPLESVTSHTVDGSEIQMDDLDSRRDVVVVSPERLQPGNRTDSDSLPATRAVLLHTAQYHQLSTEENQDNIARNENAMTAETPSFPTTFDTRAPPPTGDRVVSELGDIDDATERLSLQQGSINSLDEQRQFRERETEPGAEASALQSDEKNSSKISVVDSNFHQTELLGEKTPNTLVKDKREEQEGPETPRYDESTGDTGGNTASRKGLEPAELLETQFLISSSLLSTDVDRANKDGHDCKIQDAQSQHHRTEGLKVEGEEGEGQVVEENEVERKDIIGGEVERHEAENKEVKGEQVEDVETKSRNAEASTKDEGELRTKDE